MRVQQLFTFAVLAVTRVAAAAQVRAPSGRSDGGVLVGILDGILDALSRLDRCGGGGGPVDRCLEDDLVRALDDVTREYGGSEYRLNRYLTVEVRPADDLRSAAGDGRSPDGLGARLLDLFDALRFRYRPEDGGDVFEGRKKKKGGKKHKMGMMMAAASMGLSVIGGLGMKMMMGGVSMIAMKALVLAKIALILSAIMALKKLMHGGGGGGGALPTWGGFGGGGGGGGNEHGGYRRSYGPPDDAVPGLTAADATAYRDQPPGPYNAHYTH